MIQFASKLLDYSTQYGSQESTTYTASNVLGKPSVFPEYGDSAYTFTTKEYGKLLKYKSFHFKSIQLNETDIDAKDFIDVAFEHAVIPECVTIYETFNPGSVVRVSAFNPSSQRWAVLWSDRPQIVPKRSRAFKPPIKNIKYAVRILRIELDHSFLDYYGAIDAISLMGMPEGGIQSLSLTELCSQYDVTDLRKAGAKSEKCGEVNTINQFESLPVEVIRLILKKLDLISLCNVTCVSRFFLKVASDPLFYRTLHLKQIWFRVTLNVLSSLMRNRMELCTKIDLRLCGSRGTTVTKDFSEYLVKFGHQLTSLILGCCAYVDHSVVNKIMENCPNLEELDLSSYGKDLSPSLPFNGENNLKKLKYLNLYNSSIHWSIVSKMLALSKGLQYLDLGCYTQITQGGVDSPACQIYSLKQLKLLNLWRCHSMTMELVIIILYCCKLLEDLNIGWCRHFLHADLEDFIMNVGRNGKNLKCICLAGLRYLNDGSLLILGNGCKQLRLLDILGNKLATVGGLYRFLKLSKELKYLDISCCKTIPSAAVSFFQTKFSKVNIEHHCSDFNQEEDSSAFVPPSDDD